MRPCACPNALARRGAALVVAFVAAVLLQCGTATAQSCDEIPPFNDDECRDSGNSISDYKECYRDLYDKNIIKAFDFLASCAHKKVAPALRGVLEQAAKQEVTDTIKPAIDEMEHALAAPRGPAACLQELNTIANGDHDHNIKGLKDWMAEEAAAPDLDAYRRSHYGLEQLTRFTTAVLLARQNRADCGGGLQSIRTSLELLAALKAHHPNYCQMLGSVKEQVRQRLLDLQSLAQQEIVTIDPDIDFDPYFHVSITFNTQCGYYEPIGYTPCVEATVEYQQILSDLHNGSLGWLFDHRDAIAALAWAGGAAIAGAAGAGAGAGPIGALVGAGVGAIISGIDWWWAHNEIDELNQLIADKKQELHDVIARSYISEAEFDTQINDICRPWQSEIDHRVQAMLAGLHADEHVKTIDAYFALSDNLHTWYNELFLWATEPDAQGQRLIDELAKDELLAQRDAFDQQIFRARTDQEIAVQRNQLINLKAQTSLLDCTDIPAHQHRSVQGRLRGGLHAFNLTCSSLMQAIAVRTAQPVPFTESTATSDVSCAYTGFRSDVAALEIRAGAGFTADMTLRDAAGAVLAEFSTVSSDTPAAGFAGFACTSESGAPFGTSAASRLTPGTYPLQLADNIYGFGDEEARALRPFIQDVDSQMRFKALVCNRQLGTPIDLPRTADACGIPVGF